MRSNRLISAVAIVGLTILSTNAKAVEPGTDFSELLHPAGVVLPPDPPSGSAVLSDACPATNLGVLDSAGGSIVGSTGGAGHDFNAIGCPDSGRDVIFEFTVDDSGVWFLDTCTVPACWDTTLVIREETGGGCPGEFVACDGDGCDACSFESRLVTYLTAGTTYFLIVDGRNVFNFGDFEVTYYKSELCQADVDCDDGVFCNGIERCDVATNECAGGAPCVLYQTCDEVNDVCIDPDPCITWRAGPRGPYALSNACPGFASWLLDDIQTSKHTSDVLDFYTTPIIARSTPPGASPLGAAYSVEQALWTVEAWTCNPLAIIAGTECTNFGVVAPDGSPPDLMQCGGTMTSLPNNDGDFDRCEVDFFMGYRTAENGAFVWINQQLATIGGPGAADEYGINVVWAEDCPPSGTLQPLCGALGCVQANFADAEVCQKPGGSCCAPDGSCSLTSEEDCAAAGGDHGFTGTINGTDGGCGGDPDGDGVDNLCGDNCPDAANPDQEDCDDDGEGDACEADEADQDDDGDGVCNGLDTCPLNPDPNQDDTDGDGAGDPCDPCPLDPLDDQDNDGFCDSDEACDLDPLKQLPGPCGCDFLDDDSDGDGVPDCNDLCPGVDDAVFAPQCKGAIPTTSQWSLIVLTLLLLAGGKIFFGGRHTVRSTT